MDDHTNALPEMLTCDWVSGEFATHGYEGRITETITKGAKDKITVLMKECNLKTIALITNETRWLRLVRHCVESEPLSGI